MSKLADYRFEFDTNARGAITRTPNKGGMAPSVRFGIYAVATIEATGKAYRLNIYENRDGSIDVVVYGKGRLIPENALRGLRNVAIAIYRDTFHNEHGSRTREETPHARHIGKPSGRVIQTDTGFALEWIAEPAPAAVASFAELPAGRAVEIFPGCFAMVLGSPDDIPAMVDMIKAASGDSL